MPLNLITVAMQFLNEDMRALRWVNFGSNCLAGEHRVWPDKCGGLHTRTIGAGPADGDRLQDSAAISKGVRPAPGLFYQPQPLAGTGPVCCVATSRYPGYVRSSCFECSSKSCQQGARDNISNCRPRILDFQGLLTHFSIHSLSALPGEDEPVQSRLVQDSTLCNAVNPQRSLTNESGAVLKSEHNGYLRCFTVRPVLANLQ